METTQTQDTRIPVKINSKVAKVLAVAVSKEKNRYAIASVHVEDGRLVATNGVFMVIVHLPHNIAQGQYRVEGDTLWPDEEAGIFPDFDRLFPSGDGTAQAKYVIGFNNQGWTFWATLVRAVRDLGRDLDLAGFVRPVLDAVGKFKPDTFSMFFGEEAGSPVSFDFAGCSEVARIQLLVMPIIIEAPTWVCCPSWLLAQRGDEIQPDGGNVTEAA